MKIGRNRYPGLRAQCLLQDTTIKSCEIPAISSSPYILRSKGQTGVVQAPGYRAADDGLSDDNGSPLCEKEPFYICHVRSNSIPTRLVDILIVYL